MKLRSAISVLLVCLFLTYNIGGLYASGVPLNNSGIMNNSMVQENKTIDLVNNTSLNANNASLNYEHYSFDSPNWDNFKDLHVSPITNFVDYRKSLITYVSGFTSTDDNNVKQSVSNYNNNSGYFSGNPQHGDIDYRYMPTSELNEAYGAASVAKSRIAIPDSLSSNLQAQYTIGSVILGALSGIFGILSGIFAIVTAGTAGGASPVLITLVVITSLITSTTIAIGVCTAVIAQSSSGIGVQKGKIDNRLTLMNAELTYRSTLPMGNTMSTQSLVINNTNNTLNATNSYKFYKFYKCDQYN